MEIANLTDYILSHSDEEGELLAALNRDANVNLLHPRMLSGHLQGRILKMFCRMMRPKRILEIGTYTAYATLCLAEGIDKDAVVHTIEINDEMEDFIMKYLDKSPLKSKIKLYFGDAMDIIPQLNETFDMVFGSKPADCTVTTASSQTSAVRCWRATPPSGVASL